MLILGNQQSMEISTEIRKSEEDSDAEGIRTDLDATLDGDSQPKSLSQEVSGLFKLLENHIKDVDCVHVNPEEEKVSRLFMEAI